MKKLTPATLLGLSLLAFGCNGGKGGEDDGLTDDQKPQQTEWMTVVDQLPFPLTGDAKINRITIGRKESNMNFANRGDVEVLFDQDAEVITIEMQVYDFTDELSALGDGTDEDPGTFKRMSLWAFTGGGAPSKPEYDNPEKNCADTTWKDGCSVVVYYDGLSQPVRSGANLRVHLPKKYRGELNVQTEDNLAESTYPRLGNVKITDWCSSGSVKMSQGKAEIKMCRELTPAPTCPADQVAGCENFEVDGENAAWDPMCGCPGELYGQVRIESLKPWAADITVDMPDTTWVNVTAQNAEEDKPHECLPRIENCAGDKCTITTDDMYEKVAEFNYPSPAATQGAGFNLTVISAGCGEVPVVADDWTPESTPDIELHGHIKVCTGCLN
jgi:hypothetical protein